MSNVLMDISLHADTQHRTVDLSWYQFIWEIINTSQLTIFEAIFRWDTCRRLSTAIHNPMRVMEQSNWLRYSWFCIRSSARGHLPCYFRKLSISCVTSHVKAKQRCKYTTSVDIQKYAIKSSSLIESHIRQERSESAREWRTALYKRSISTTIYPLYMWRKRQSSFN